MSHQSSCCKTRENSAKAQDTLRPRGDLEQTSFALSSRGSAQAIDRKDLYSTPSRISLVHAQKQLATLRQRRPHGAGREQKKSPQETGQGRNLSKDWYARRTQFQKSHNRNPLTTDTGGSVGREGCGCGGVFSTQVPTTARSEAEATQQPRLLLDLDLDLVMGDIFGLLRATSFRSSSLHISAGDSVDVGMGADSRVRWSRRCNTYVALSCKAQFLFLV